MREMGVRGLLAYCSGCTAAVYRAEAAAPLSGRAWMDTLRQSLICGKSRTSVVVQFVQALQVTHCRYLQEIEIEIAGITKVGEITMEGGTPMIVLAHTAVA
jgi:hypothetical protein